jgi:hypothetical protein
MQFNKSLRAQRSNPVNQIATSLPLLAMTQSIDDQMTNKTKQLNQLLSERILILDGAMGTMIQRHKLEEADYRGEPFRASMSSTLRRVQTSSRPIPLMVRAFPCLTTIWKNWFGS